VTNFHVLKLSIFRKRARVHSFNSLKESFYFLQLIILKLHISQPVGSGDAGLKAPVSMGVVERTLLKSVGVSTRVGSWRNASRNTPTRVHESLVPIGILSNEGATLGVCGCDISSGRSGPRAQTPKQPRARSWQVRQRNKTTSSPAAGRFTGSGVFACAVRAV
jgi:hypothetical protein